MTPRDIPEPSRPAPHPAMPPTNPASPGTRASRAHAGDVAMSPVRQSGGTGLRDTFARDPRYTRPVDTSKQ
jgi:hypothetical protein